MFVTLQSALDTSVTFGQVAEFRINIASLSGYIIRIAKSHEILDKRFKEFYCAQFFTVCLTADVFAVLLLTAKHTDNLNIGSSECLFLKKKKEKKYSLSKPLISVSGNR